MFFFVATQKNIRFSFVETAAEIQTRPINTAWRPGCFHCPYELFKIFSSLEFSQFIRWHKTQKSPFAKEF